ncbi:hypothetical protein [Streptomyces parvus]|uniref:hypothetical protein n=1 Tax=Streptomyces parvus TaxID=66428 RepID=UPI0035D62559
MIPYGVTPADDQMAADIFGVSLGYWRDKKMWKTIPGLRLLSPPGARRRVFSKQQLLVAQQQRERAKALNQVPKYDLPPVPAGEDPRDLLNLQEARLALPEDQRVTLDTWKGYRYGSKTRLPDPDDTVGGKESDNGAIVGGEDFWRRQTILDWNDNRSGPGNPKGRPTGSKNARPRAADHETEERRHRAAQLFQGDHRLRSKDLADDLGVHAVHAERILRDLRLEELANLLVERPGMTVAEVQNEFGVAHTSHTQKLISDAQRHQQARQLLRDQPDLTAQELAEEVAVDLDEAARILRAVLLERDRFQVQQTRLLLQKAPSQVTPEQLADHLDVPRDQAVKLLHRAMAGSSGEAQ